MNDKCEFLAYLYQVCDMGYNSTKYLLGMLNKKENKITTLIETENREYENSLKELEKLISNTDIDSIKSGIIAKTSSKIGMTFELMRDNSDSKIADMLIQGYTMGVLEITRKLKKYKSCLSKEEQKIADEVLDYQNKNIKLLKKYL